MDGKNVKDIPVYPYSSAYAQEAGETAQFRESRLADDECRRFIDIAIDIKQDASKAAKDALDQFGPERVVRVLANTIQQKGFGQYFSESNRDWARSVPMFLPLQKRWAISLRSHPARLEEFIARIREELERTPFRMESAETLKTLPLYLESPEFAAQHGETAQCLASHDANVACKEAIEAALAQNDGGAAQRVTEQYGVERTLFVLAETVRSREPDERISPDNRAWAAAQPSPDTRDALGRNMGAAFQVLGDSAVISAFLTRVRQEGALSRERRGDAEKISPTQSGVSRQRNEKPSIRKLLARKIPVINRPPAKAPRREAR